MLSLIWKDKVLNYDKMFRLKKKNVKNEVCFMHAV